MTDQGGSLMLIIDVILVAVLAAGLIYGLVMWHTRRRNRVTEQIRDDATERLYRKQQ